MRVILLVVTCFLGKTIPAEVPEGFTRTECTPDRTVFGVGRFMLAFFLLHGQPPGNDPPSGNAGGRGS